MANEFFSKHGKILNRFKLSQTKVLAIVFTFLLLGIGGFWLFNNYFSVTTAEVKSVEGQVNINTKDGPKNLTKDDKSKISVGDKISVDRGSVGMIVLSNGESYILAQDQQVIFSRIEKGLNGDVFYFTDLEKGKEIVVNSSTGLSKNSAAVLSNINLAPTQSGKVLGASDYQLSESQKYEKFLTVSACIDKDQDTKNYSKSLQNCLDLNGIKSLEDIQ